MNATREDVWVVRMVLLLGAVLLLHPAAAWAAQEEANSSVNESAAPATSSPAPVTQGVDWTRVFLRGGLYGATWAALAVPAYLLLLSRPWGPWIVGLLTVVLPPLSALWMVAPGGLWAFGQALPRTPTWGHVVSNTIKLSVAVTSGLYAWFLSQWLFGFFFEKKTDRNGARDSGYRTTGILPIFERIGS